MRSTLLFKKAGGLVERILDVLSRRVTELSRSRKNGILLAVDMALVPIALLTALALFGRLLESSIFQTTILFLTLIAAAGGLSVAMGLPRIKLNSYEQSGILRTASFSVGVGVVGYVCLTAVSAGPDLVQLMFVFTMILLILTVGTRIFLRSLLVRMYQRGTYRQRVLIYGAGQTGLQLATALGRDDAVVPVA